MNHRPSSLPMLAQCPCFEGSGTEFAELGAARHKALQAHYAGDDSLLDALDDDSQEGVKWAAAFICAKSTDSYPLVWETKRQWTRPDFSPAEGTPDVTNGAVLFDFKWRYRNYEAQMADYALWLIEQGFERVTVHLLFGAEQWAETLHFTFDGCEAILMPILKSLENPQPKPCDYCGWCAKRAVCPAYIASVKQLRRVEVEDIFTMPKVAAWVEAGCHTSELVSDAELVALLLRWSRQFKKIHDGIEHFAKEAAIKHGLKIPGFELKERQGKKFIGDVEKAYEAIELPAADFLKACDVRLNTSKKYPERKGLDFVVKEKCGEASLAAAKRRITAKLGDLIQRGKNTLSLVSEKGEEGEEE